MFVDRALLKGLLVNKCNIAVGFLPCNIALLNDMQSYCIPHVSIFQLFNTCPASTNLYF